MAFSFLLEIRPVNRNVTFLGRNLIPMWEPRRLMPSCPHALMLECLDARMPTWRSMRQWIHVVYLHSGKSIHQLASELCPGTPPHVLTNPGTEEENGPECRTRSQQGIVM